MEYQLGLDFEMCMVRGNARKRMSGMTNEIIQIGAVMLNEEHHIADEFSSYVKPEFGSPNAFIEELTGINEEDLRNAPLLQSALNRFMSWIGDRQVTVISWSDSDYQQLIGEMRAKKIKHHGIQDLLDGWVDFQRSFGNMLGIKRQIALEEAMSVGRLQPMGRQHDGLSDAYNTARLLAKVHRQPAFHLEFQPIVSYAEKMERLSFSMGNLFTPELLAQFNLLETTKETEEDMGIAKKNWSVPRRIYAYFKGEKAATDEEWNRMRFMLEMKKLNLKDFFEVKLKEALYE